MNKKTRVLLLASLSLIAGPSFANEADKLQDFLANKPENLQPFYKALYVEGERNAVLNFNLLGLAAMEAGNFQAAERAFDESIKRIDSIYADDENARKAKSIWSEEKVKDWKGEPYERAMTYFYRGLLYIRSGDYDNAAASFRAADYQDTQAEQEAYQGDFGLMPYMAGWAQSCRGNKVQANDLFTQAKTKDSSFSQSFAAMPADARFIAVIDSGVGPRKVGTGKHKELLSVEDRGSKDVVVKVLPSAGERAKVTDSYGAGDVYFQASTRGGRQVDGVLNGKAQWKEGTNTAGEVATNVGLAAMQVSAMTDDGNMAMFGALTSLFGVVTKAVSEAMTPAADTRYWGSLPRNISIAAVSPPEPVAKPPEHVAKETAKGKAIKNSAKAKAVDANVLAVESAPPAGGPQANALPKLVLSYNDGKGEASKPITFMASNGPCGVAWARTHSALATAQGGLANLSANPAPDDSGREEKNLAFRFMLQETF